MAVEQNRPTALVTGGSRGIGAEIVRDLRKANHAVYFTYAQDEQAAASLVTELGDEGLACERYDLDGAASPEALIAHVVGRFGRIDTLVNNAGVFAANPFDGPDFAAWREGWQRTFAVNVFGAVDLTYFALRRMRGAPADAHGTRGRVVNITSRAAHRGELTFADYGASKAALGNFTKSIARGCAKFGIVAFSIAPGFIETDMARDAIARDGEAIRAEIPSGRIGAPRDIAQLTTFLASGGADYATGSTFDVNGASYVR